MFLFNPCAPKVYNYSATIAASKPDLSYSGPLQDSFVSAQGQKQILTGGQRKKADVQTSDPSSTSSLCKTLVTSLSSCSPGVRPPRPVSSGHTPPTSRPRNPSHAENKSLSVFAAPTSCPHSLGRANKSHPVALRPTRLSTALGHSRHSWEDLKAATPACCVNLSAAKMRPRNWKECLNSKGPRYCVYIYIYIYVYIIYIYTPELQLQLKGNLCAPCAY